MSEEIKDIILDVKDSLNETPKNMYKYNKITLNLNEFEEILNYIEQLEKENKKLKEENKRIFQNVNDDELLISNAMNYAELKKTEKKVEQLENIRKEAIKYILKNKLYRFKYDDEELFEITTDKKAKDDLLNILNKGSDKDGNNTNETSTGETEK